MIHFPCAIKEHGFYEGIGHATSSDGAETVFRQAVARLSDESFVVHRKLIRLDGKNVEAFTAERT